MEETGKWDWTKWYMDSIEATMRRLKADNATLKEQLKEQVEEIVKLYEENERLKKCSNSCDGSLPKKK